MLREHLKKKREKHKEKENGRTGKIVLQVPSVAKGTDGQQVRQAHVHGRVGLD